MEKSAQLRTISVKSIVEYPTQLGSRCLLLRELGLDAYWNTEEEILEAITASAKDTSNLDICLNHSRCRAFWDKYQAGITPYNDIDPIRLVQYDGRFWVQEGKHRVCMAKRAGVDTIEANVWQMRADMYTLLEPRGKPGVYRFQRRGKRGEVAVLWFERPPGMEVSVCNFFPVVLDEAMDTGGQSVELMPGLSYSVKSSPIRTLRTEVAISSSHYNTRIWLLKAPAPRFGDRLGKLETVYRTGCWRNHHLERVCVALPHER